jgi:LCP family protein required for cell wall assembly
MKHVETSQTVVPEYRARHMKVKKKHTLAKVLISIAIVIALVAGAGVYLLGRLQQNIDTETLNTGSNPKVTQTAPVDVAVDPLNVMIIGTDTRSGNTQYGGEEMSSGYGKSDVMLLLHLSADKKNASIISFPRDMMAPIPSCKDPETGTVSYANDHEQLNAALSTGGPGCTVAAISDLTGLNIHHMMLADFNAVKELSNAIGGVEVCVSAAVNDEKSGLNIPSGISEVQGEQALAFLRTRSAFGDGSDLGRIKAQQSFLASMARKITSEGTLTDIPKLYSIADTITQNLTVDKSLASTTELLKLADRMRKINTANIELITVPNEPDPLDPNRVVLSQPKADEVFKALINDQPVVPKKTETTPSPSPSATGEVPVTETPVIEYERNLLDVDVTNRSGVKLRAEKIQEFLVSIGYLTATAGKDDTTIPQSQIFYNYGFKEYAEQLARDLGLSEAQVQYSDTTVNVSLVIGEDLGYVTKAVDAPTGLGAELQGQTADQATCQSVR